MARPLRILIVDDELPARRLLRRLLERREDIVLLEDCRTGTAAFKRITEQAPDLVLLDIQLADMTGLDVVREVGVDQMPAVVFVTAFDDYAVQAFELHAVDYLLKPYSDERLQTAIDRACQRLKRTPRDRNRQLKDLMADWQHETPEDKASNETYVQQVLIREGRNRLTIGVGRVRYFEAEDHYVRLHADSGKSHLLSFGLSELEKQLDPGKFVRIHRRTIVNTAAVARVETARFGAYTVILNDGSRLPVARGRRESLRHLLPAAGKKR